MLLELEHVEKSYPAADGQAALSILKNLSLNVEAGESVSIMGPSGSGKSTLLHIIGALDRPSGGAVRISGRDLSLLSDRELAKIRNREIGFVFQLHYLLPQCTALENVLIPALAGTGEGATPALRERAGTLLVRVGLAARMGHLPGQLSGGECQRVAVVRALIHRPRLLLADEPTGSLDPAAADNLAQLLVDLNREEGTALVLVTHSAVLAGRMSRRFRLVAGELKEE